MPTAFRLTYYHSLPGNNLPGYYIGHGQRHSLIRLKYKRQSLYEPQTSPIGTDYLITRGFNLWTGPCPPPQKSRRDDLYPNVKSSMPTAFRLTYYHFLPGNKLPGYYISHAHGHSLIRLKYKHQNPKTKTSRKLKTSPIGTIDLITRGFNLWT
jgi:hypothetical protein